MKALSLLVNSKER